MPGTTSSNPRLDASTAAEASHVFSTGPVTLYGLVGYSSNAGAQFIQLHDAASLPADGAVPKISFTVAAASNFSLAATLVGMRFETGLVVCNSSNATVKAIGAADCFFSVNIQ